MITHQLIPAKPVVTASPSFTFVRDGLLQRKCACGGTIGPSGTCAECEEKQRNLQRKANDQSELGASVSPSRLPALQPKLTIGASNDPLEQEADRVADQVLAAPTHPAVSGSRPNIQRLSVHPTDQAEEAPASVDRVLASPGTPLDAALQGDMSQRFDHDFSRVRVHYGAAAEQSAREINANAYTVGHNIVFGAGQFAPGSHEGRRLLAHELTHVVQQRGSNLHAKLQADFAVEPTVATPVVTTLTAAEIVAAVTYNQRKVTLPDEISLLRDILGLSRTPADIDDDFVQAVVRYQASYGLTQDGKLGPVTVTQLSKEVIAEGTFLGAGNRGSLELEYSLRDDLQA